MWNASTASSSFNTPIHIHVHKECDAVYHVSMYNAPSTIKFFIPSIIISCETAIICIRIRYENEFQNFFLLECFGGVDSSYHRTRCFSSMAHRMKCFYGEKFALNVCEFLQRQYGFYAIPIFRLVPFWSCRAYVWLCYTYSNA